MFTYQTLNSKPVVFWNISTQALRCSALKIKAYKLLLNYFNILNLFGKQMCKALLATNNSTLGKHVNSASHLTEWFMSDLSRVEKSKLSPAVLRECLNCALVLSVYMEHIYPGFEDW